MAVIFIRRLREFPGSPVAGTLCFHPGALVQSPVEELRSHKSHSIASQIYKVNQLYTSIFKMEKKIKVEKDVKKRLKHKHAQRGDQV